MGKMSDGGTFKDLFPPEFVLEWATSHASEGDVFRMKLDKREQIIPKNEGETSRNKYFVIAGVDAEGNALGFFVLDSKINQNLPLARQEKHLRLSSAKYPFMNGEDRYADCSDFKMITKERFAEMFETEKEKGSIDADDMTLIKDYARSYKNANKPLLKRFGLL